MYAIINEQKIPDKTLQFVTMGLGGSVNIRGEAINEDHRIELNEIMEPLHEGDVVEFDVEDNDYHRFHGAGRINKTERNEEGVGSLMRIRFSIAIQYAH